jgi:hypothetical protein
VACLVTVPSAANSCIRPENGRKYLYIPLSVQFSLSNNVAFRYNSDSGTQQTKITHPTTSETFMVECSALLQILLPLVTFCYTSDNCMWHYGMTGIAHVAFSCKSCKKPWAGYILKPPAGIKLYRSATCAIPVIPSRHRFIIKTVKMFV